MKAGEFEEAAAAFQRAILMNPGFAESHHNRAAALLQLERWDEAAAVYRNAIELDRADPSLRANQGVALFRAERFGEAADALQAAIVLGDDAAQWHSIRANALGRLERWEEASTALQRAIELEPENAAHRAGLANALIQRGMHAEAAAALREAMKRDGGSVEQHANLANLLVRLGREDEAAVIVERLLALEGGTADHHAQVGQALASLGRMEESVAALRRAVELRADDPVLQTRLGSVLLEQGRWGEAAAAFARSVELDPTNPVFFKGLGAALFEAGSWEGSASAYRHALALDPGDSEAYANLATTLAKLEPSAEALAAYEEMVELAPDDAAAHLGLGVELAKTERFEDALASLRRARELQPQNAGSLFLQVDPLLRLGRGSEAAAVHREAVAQGGDVPALPGGAAADVFERRRGTFWEETNLPASVFRIERWLQELGRPKSETGGAEERRLLFVLDNDYGELTTLMYLVLGRELAGRSTLLLPDRLVGNNADALPGRTHAWASVDDILERVDAERPAVVFLCSAYLYSIHGLLSLDELERLTGALRERGCRVVTADPFLGMLSLQDPRKLVGIHIPEHSDELDIEEIRKVKAVEDERLRSEFSRSEAILREFVHLYPSNCEIPAGGPVEPGATDVRNVSFFNDALICPELGARGEVPDGDAPPLWLFIVSRTDYETQMMFEGRRFSDIVAQKLVDARAAGRHPVLIAPDELVQSVISRMPTAEGIDILTFCPFNRMISLLLAAEQAFYWNIVSHSILVRLFNRLPVVLFDQGHLVRNVKAMLPRVVQWYYQGFVPEFRDHREPLTPETVAAWTRDYLERADEIDAGFRRAPTPEAMVERLAAGVAETTGREPAC